MNEVRAVPDLELTLQDSKYFEPEKLQLHFRPSRKYAASTHYIHFRVPFNFTNLLQTPKYIRIWSEPFKTQVKQVVEVSRSCITDKVGNFMDLLDALPRHTTITRTKWQFDLISFGIVTANITLSTYNAIQISKLENKIAANKKKVDHLNDITNLHEKHFKAVDQKLDDISHQFATMLLITKFI